MGHRVPGFQAGDWGWHHLRDLAASEPTRRLKCAAVQSCIFLPIHSAAEAVGKPGSHLGPVDLAEG